MEEYYKEAKKIVKKKKAFYKNLYSWLIVSAFLFLLNMLTAPGFHWWIFPFLGWGLGVAFNYLDAFGIGKIKNGWEKKEIEKEMNRLHQRKQESDESFELPLDEIPNRENLELPDFETLKKKWDDQEFV